MSQLTSLTGNGQRIYYKFYAQKNCSYIFQTCSITSQDTELEILKDSSFIPQIFNDDWCSFQSYINWIAPNNGWFIIYITRYSGSTCKTLNSNIQLKYQKDCGIVMSYEPEEEVQAIIIKEQENPIVKLYELDGREVALDSKGILIAEYENGDKRITKIK